MKSSRERYERRSTGFVDCAIYPMEAINDQVITTTMVDAASVSPHQLV